MFLSVEPCNRIARGPTFCWISPAAKPAKRLNPSVIKLVVPAGAPAIQIHVLLLHGAIDPRRTATSPSADQSLLGEGQERSLRVTHSGGHHSGGSKPHIRIVWEAFAVPLRDRLTTINPRKSTASAAPSLWVTIALLR